mgnify:CR=1 FL=1
MEKSTIIKLRQQEATSVATNGDYNVSLKEQVLLEEGDMVKVHSVILATNTESVINVEEDTRVKMGVAKYFRQIANNKPTNFTTTPLIDFSVPDLNLQWAVTKHPSTGENFFVQAIYMFSTSLDEAQKFGGIDTIWEYYAVGTGKKTNITISLPRQYTARHANRALVVPFGEGGHGVHCLGKYFKLIHPTVDELDKRSVKPFVTLVNIAAGEPVPDNIGANNGPFPLILQSGVAWGDGGTPVDNTPSVLELFEEELSFVIKAQTYQPAELAQIINDKMVEIDSLGSVGNNYPQNAYPVNNPFLSTVAQINHKISLLKDKEGTTPQYFHIPGANESLPIPQQLMFFDPIPTTMGDDRFIGANEVSMNYDENLDRLNFDTIHFPQYVSGGGGGAINVPGIVYPTPGNLYPNIGGGADVPIPSVAQVSYGGVAFTRLEAFNVSIDSQTGVETVLSRSNFWTTLGFENMTIQALTADPSITITLTDATTVRPLVISSELGKNITGALPSIDIVVPKTANFDTPVNEDVENSFTTPIISARGFGQVANDEGYYMLEIGIDMPQKLIGGFDGDNMTTSNKVQAILGKYFTSGNFLQSQGSGEILYTHVGEPQLIRDLNVRIVHPDFSSPLPNELGDKNSVFLEVVKAVNVAPVKK